ncbi:MAG: hypothetical protein OQJ97_12745 [Rhodospirillales bacterium]|nr:hypothetical protein [Rhodospirillales bacterium]
MSYGAENWILVDNETDRPIKVVAPGGGGFVPAHSKGTKLTFNSDTENGDIMISWWIDNPRQICKIYTRWQGTMYLNGEKEIRCRAH